MWQQLYSQIAHKNSISIDGVKTHIEFIKQCLSYTHLSPQTLNEDPSNKNMFQRSLRSKTIAFIISQFTESLIETTHQTAVLI